MSDASNASTATQSMKTEKKPRSPVERMIVWGGIIILLGVVAVEARARKGYEWTLGALEKELEKDEGAAPQPLLVRDIDKHVIGWPTKSVSESGSLRTITLTWGGLFRTHGIDLTYDSSPIEGEEPAVLSMVTHGAPEAVTPPVPAETAETDASSSGPPPGMGMGMGMAGPGGGGGPGGPGGGGGGRFNPMEQDADGDGKISKEEAQGRFLENFDRNDTDGDGFITEEEIAAMRERFRSERGGEGGGGGRGRPESESAPGTVIPPGGGGPFQEFGPGGRKPGDAPPESSGSTEQPADSTPPDSSTPKEGAEPQAGEKAADEAAP